MPKKLHLSVSMVPCSQCIDQGRIRNMLRKARIPPKPKKKKTARRRARTPIQLSRRFPNRTLKARYRVSRRKWRNEKQLKLNTPHLFQTHKQSTADSMFGLIMALYQIINSKKVYERPERLLKKVFGFRMGHSNHAPFCDKCFKRSFSYTDGEPVNIKPSRIKSVRRYPYQKKNVYNRYMLIFRLDQIRKMMSRRLKALLSGICKMIYLFPW